MKLQNENRLNYLEKGVLDRSIQNPEDIIEIIEHNKPYIFTRFSVEWDSNEHSICSGVLDKINSSSNSRERVIFKGVLSFSGSIFKKFSRAKT